MTNIKKRIMQMESTPPPEYAVKPNNAWWDTLVSANANYRIDICFRYSGTRFGSYIWGVDNRNYSYHSLQTTTKSGYTNHFRVYNYDQEILTTYPAEYNNWYKVSVYGITHGSVASVYFLMNDENIGVANAAGGVAPTTYYLGASHRLNVGANSPSGQIDIKYFRIYGADHTTLLCNCVPQWNNGDAMLYDTISNRWVEWQGV